MELVLLAIMILDRPAEGEVRLQRTNPFIRRTSQFKLGIQPIQFGRVDLLDGVTTVPCFVKCFDTRVPTFQDVSFLSEKSVDRWCVSWGGSIFFFSILVPLGKRKSGPGKCRRDRNGDEVGSELPTFRGMHLD